VSQFEHAENLAESSSTSTSYVSALTCNRTPATAALKWVIFYQAELRFSSTGSGDLAHVRFVLDGVTVHEDEIAPKDASDYIPVSFVYSPAALPASQFSAQIEVKKTGTGTIEYRNRRIVAWQLTPDVDSFDSSETAFSDTGWTAAVPQVIVPMGAADRTYLLFWGGCFKHDDSSDKMEVRAVLGGVEIGYARLDQEDDSLYRSVQGFALRSLPIAEAGYVFKLEMQRVAGGGTITSRYGSLVAIPVDDATDFSPVLENDDRYVAVDAETDVDTGQTIPASVGGSESITYTAEAIDHLVLAMAEMNGSGASSSQYLDAKLDDGTFLLGHGTEAEYTQFEPNATTLYHSFFGFAHKVLTSGEKTDRIGFAVESDSAEGVRRRTRLLALHLGASAPVVESLTLTDVVTTAVTKMLDAQTMTFTDEIDVRYVYDANLTLSALAQLTLTAEKAQSVNLVASVLAFLEPTQPDKDYWGPVQLVVVHFQSGDRYYSHDDIYVTHPTPGWTDQLFKGLSLGVAEIPNQFVDQFLQFQNLESITLALGNLDGEFAFLRTEEARGAMVDVWAWDPINDEMEHRFGGVITDRRIGWRATFAVSMQPTQLFAKQIPEALIEKKAGTPFATAVDVGFPVPELLGSRKKVRCLLVAVDQVNSTFDYIFSRRETTAPQFAHGSSLTVNTVYRNGRLVDPAEWSALPAGSPVHQGYFGLRFLRDQQGAVITCDVSQGTAALRNPVRVAQWLMAKVGSEPVNVAAFDAAASEYDTIMYPTAAFHLDVYLDDQRAFSDVLADCMHRFRLERNAACEWIPVLDVQPTEASLLVEVGGVYDNVIDVGELQSAPIDRAPSEFIFAYNFTRGFLQNQSLYQAEKRAAGFSISRAQPARFANPYVVEHYAADAIVQYRAQRLKTNDEKLPVTLGMVARNLKLHQLVLATIAHPSFGSFVRNTFEVYSIARGRDRYGVLLARFDASIYNFVRHTDTDDEDPIDPTVPDLTFSPPPAPFSIALDTAKGGAATPGFDVQVTTGTDGTGTTRSTVHLLVALPAENIGAGIYENGTHIALEYRVNNEPKMNAPGAEILITDAMWGGAAQEFAVGGLTPGLQYDFMAFIKNVNNDKVAQEGPRLTLDNQVAAGDKTAPSTDNLDILVTEGTGKTLDVTVRKLPGYVEQKDLRFIRWYRTTSSSSTPPAETAFFRASSDFSIVDADVPKGTTYYYWAKLEDFSGNQSDFIPYPRGRDSGGFTEITTPDVADEATTRHESYADSFESIVTNTASWAIAARATLVMTGVVSGSTLKIDVDANVRLISWLVSDIVEMRIEVNGVNKYTAEVVNGITANATDTVVQPVSKSVIVTGLSGTVTIELLFHANAGSAGVGNASIVATETRK